MNLLTERSTTDPEGLILHRGVFDPDESNVTVRIPPYITEIQSGAFRDCSNIAEVIIPPSVRLIGQEAFRNCRNLKRVEVSDLIFSGCSIHFGRDVFKDCQKLATPDGFVFLQAVGLSKAETVLCEYYGPGGSVTIPEGTTAVIGNVFSDRKDITKVFIPDGVRMIGQAFRNCCGLENIRIPESVQTVEQDSFAGCWGLADEQGFLIVRNILFGYRGDKQHLEVPDGITAISSMAFRELNDLETVTIPSSVTEICGQAFYCCDHLRSVSIPDSVQKIGAQVFCECEGMADENGFVIVRDRLLHYYGDAGKVLVPEYITAIDDNCFEDAYCIEKLTLPRGLKEIGRQAFWGCDSLESIELPDGIETIPEAAFDCCHSLQHVKLPDKLQYIGYKAFQYCTSLKKIIIPEEVCLIADHAFRGCSSLEAVHFWNDRGTEIMGTPFLECDNLQTAILHEDTLIHSEDINLWLAAAPNMASEKLAEMLENCPYIGIRTELERFLEDNTDE